MDLREVIGAAADVEDAGGEKYVADAVIKMTKAVCGVDMRTCNPTAAFLRYPRGGYLAIDTEAPAFVAVLEY